jgi:glucose/arabinose dehydrogenase
MRNMCTKLLLLPLLALTCLATALKAANLPPGFVEILLAEGLDPTAMTITPDGRLLLLEKTGKVLVIENGELLPDPLLTIPVDNYNEKGLNGIAIDPDFEQNGYFYVYYTVPDSGYNRVSRFTAFGNFASPSSELVLINLDKLPGSVHNAGAMLFGKDGKLYIAIGEGGQSSLAQSLNSLLGKIIRLNRDGSIPEDNPFYSSMNNRFRAIYAYGLRNPFNLSMDAETGLIYATDVGAANWEEINLIMAGKNYGWPLVEGPLAGQNPPENYKEPLYAYSHQNGCAVIGGAIYQPSFQLFPEYYRGKYFFADYCSGNLKAIDPSNPDSAEIFASGVNRPVSIIAAPDGSLYYLARAGIGGGSTEDNTSSGNGTLWQVLYTGAGTPFISVQPADVLISEGESWKFRIRASGTEPLSYQWQKNGTDIPGERSENLLIEEATRADSGSVYRCMINNALGSIVSKNAILKVTRNKRPMPYIVQPDSNALYRAGEQIIFEGWAEDPEDGLLLSSSLRWKIDFHHLTHSHPALTPIDGTYSGFYDIPQVGETDHQVWYRVSLTSTDALGLSKTVYRDIMPVISDIRVQTIPAGLPFYTESSYRVSPDTIKSVSGIRREIRMIPQVEQNDSIYVFDRWSDGSVGTERIFITPDEGLDLTALYKSYPAGGGNGLHASYFKAEEGQTDFKGNPEFTRIDSLVNFNWQLGSPKPGEFPGDYFLVRWEGFMLAPAEEEYTIYLTSDDGSRIWFNGELMADQWSVQEPSGKSFTIPLERGHYYPVRIEYFEATGNALCKLEWSSASIPRSLIPRSQLFTVDPTDTIEPFFETDLLYPNPTNQWVVVEFQHLSDENAVLELISLDGRRILAKTLALTVGKNSISIDLQGLPGGIYWMRLQSISGYQFIRKLILQ